MNVRLTFAIFFICAAAFAGCDDDVSPDTTEPSEDKRVYQYANECVAVGVEGSGEQPSQWLQASGDTGFSFGADSQEDAARFFMKASDLKTYLFHDVGEGYLVSEDGPLIRKTELTSSLDQLDDNYISGAEWYLEISEQDSEKFQLRHRKTNEYLGTDGLVVEQSSAATLTLASAEGCTAPPEMSLDAVGDVRTEPFEDGSLFGIADTHSHILSNFGFGGGGIFHGATFHRLGVEHALPSCEPFHGEMGRKDFLGFGFSGNSAGSLDTDTLISLVSTKELPQDDHNTDGWPTFSDWPGVFSSTHQTQYYKWLKRAWKGGLRLMVQHAVSNEALCDLMVDSGIQPARWSCRDMFNIDRQITEIYRMQDYIDAQNGGPGEGWFRIVESPEQAREEIADGNLAIVLGIEVPNLFSCYLTPSDEDPECDAEYINSELDRYYEMGVRVLFPVHKYSNAFSPGDGDRGIFEVGDFFTTGHDSNYTNEDCPDVPTVFDRGPVEFGGLNEPREEYLSEPPREPLEISMNPLNDLLPYVEQLTGGSLDEGDWCQKADLTDKGRTLINGIMERGMLLEMDHLPRRSYVDAFEMIQDNDYPAIGSHGNTYDGKIYELGGVSKAGFNRCADPENPGSMAEPFRKAAAEIEAAGGFPAEGFGFDLNGFAGIPDPRFGPFAQCGSPQENPVEYPFFSYGGGVEFSQPFMGEREVDFNTEGMIHIGLMPELIEDARQTGVTDEDLEILFKSAEGYVLMWEKAEERGAALRDDSDDMEAALRQGE